MMRPEAGTLLIKTHELFYVSKVVAAGMRVAEKQLRDSSGVRVPRLTAAAACPASATAMLFTICFTQVSCSERSDFKHTTNCVHRLPHLLAFCCQSYLRVQRPPSDGSLASHSG